MFAAAHSDSTLLTPTTFSIAPPTQRTMNCITPIWYSTATSAAKKMMTGSAPKCAKELLEIRDRSRARRKSDWFPDPGIAEQGARRPSAISARTSLAPSRSAAPATPSATCSAKAAPTTRSRIARLLLDSRNATNRIATMPRMPIGKDVMPLCYPRSNPHAAPRRERATIQASRDWARARSRLDRPPLRSCPAKSRHGCADPVSRLRSKRTV